jgi:hypothetical protein
MNNEIQSIISGESQIKFGTGIQTILSYLRGSEKSGTLDKANKHFKKEETKGLRRFVEINNLWIRDINLEQYVSEGAEQKVYLKDGQSVLKLNDAIYYTCWEDYFVNLLLNNHFFPDTAYNLIGFFEKDSTLYAVVEQQFIKANQKTDLNHVRQFMESNGFIPVRKYDYYNSEFGILIEDLHDENVLTNDGMLYFIDTVFYVK